MGKTLLGYTEKEVWRMTYRKLINLYKEYWKDNKYKEMVYMSLYNEMNLNRYDDEEVSIDDAIPEG
jgi:ribosomal protein L19E